MQNGFAAQLARLGPERRYAPYSLARARAYARQSTKPLPIHSIRIPRAVADRCRPSGDFNDLCVPVEPALERTAKRLIASPRDFLPKKDEKDSHALSQLRVGGVDALRHFKSAENTALLRSLLDDPTETLQTAEQGAPNGTTVVLNQNYIDSADGATFTASTSGTYTMKITFVPNHTPGTYSVKLA